MIIFNNGKYKSILAAENGELAEIAGTVQKYKDKMLTDESVVLHISIADV